ncbi:hypothetical protein Glove_164g60 [Diversispora epigaea]|uniref:Uncharacterized protein n=1 Tax=Diversispora epigaea TaxID=1348612 RepID=A0A397IVR6_9GLOM|nr:hypothetical protein Glove_164g60 [Diversispora epigaea]
MNQEFQYYQMDLSTGLRLSFDRLEILRGKVKSFENDYQVRKGKHELSLEFECLREITRSIIHKAIEKYNLLVP